MRCDQNATAYTIVRIFAGRLPLLTKTSRLQLPAIGISALTNFVDDLQRFEQAPAGIGFYDPIKMHVWFDHANINGYDSHPLRMLTFSLHASGRAGPLKRRRRTTRFFIFPKIT
jgi:hypothetical protein